VRVAAGDRGQIDREEPAAVLEEQVELDLQLCEPDIVEVAGDRPEVHLIDIAVSWAVRRLRLRCGRSRARVGLTSLRTPAGICPQMRWWSTRVGAENPVISRDLHVLVDEAAEPVSP
jgi:hypothetical protein